MFLSDENSPHILFHSILCCWYVQCFDTLTLQEQLFNVVARLTIVFAVSSGDLFVITLFVPTCKRNWFGSSVKGGFKYSFMHFVCAPEKCIT